MGASTAAGASPVATGPGTKIGTINIEQAIVQTNEGHRDFEDLAKKLEPKRTQLTSQSDELEALKKQLTTQGDKLSPEALETLRKQIETKQKSLERAGQDYQEDVGNQQNDIAQRILQKMAPMIVKYAQENAFGMIVDTSKPWPQSPVLWYDGEKIDVTNEQVGQHIAFLAQRDGITMDKMVDRIRKNNAFGMIRQQLLREQVLDFLLKESKTE